MGHTRTGQQTSLGTTLLSHHVNEVEHMFGPFLSLDEAKILLYVKGECASTKMREIGEKQIEREQSRQKEKNPDPEIPLD